MSSASAASSPSTSPIIPTTMRAVHHLRYGPIASSNLFLVADAPVPVLKEGEALIRVSAASVNPVDYKMMLGYLSLFVKRTFPWIPLFDVSGTIVSLRLPAGASAKTLSKLNKWSLKEGNLVFADVGTRCGCLAEFIAVPIAMLARAPSPDKLSLVDSACVPLASLTAYQALFAHALMRSGERVFINGASGGCGMFAVQMAKARGAYVIATCSTRNIELVKSWGADEIIDYTQQSWWEHVEKSMKDGKEQGKEQKKEKENQPEKDVKEQEKIPTDSGINVFFDCAGDKTTWFHAQRLLAPGARYVTIRGDSQGKSSVGGAVSMVGGLIGRKIGAFFGKKIKYIYMLTSTDDSSQLEDVRKMIDEGKIRPYIEKRYEMEEFLEAIQASESGKVRGKVVILVSKSSATSDQKNDEKSADSIPLASSQPPDSASATPLITQDSATAEVPAVGAVAATSFPDNSSSSSSVPSSKTE